MNRIVLILFMAVNLLLSSRVYSQITFSKLYNNFGVWEAATQVLRYDANIIVLAGTAKNFGVTDSTRFRKIYVWTLDSNQKASIIYNFGNYRHDFSGMVALKPVYNSTNLSIVLNNDSIDYRIVRTDPIGNVLDIISIEAPPDFASLYWLLRGDKIYVWGVDATKPTTLSPMRVMCVDTTGKLVWYKRYPKAYRVVDARHMGTNHFLISGSYIKGNEQEDTSVGWYAQMDTLGNIVWEKYLNKKDVYEAPGAFIASLNGKYYVAGSNDGSEKLFPFPVRDTSFLYMYQIDNQGNPLWYKRTYTSPWVKYVGAASYTEKNGYMYAIGNLQTTEGWAGTTTYLTLLKFDSAGNMLWQRLFKQWYRDNRPYSLTPVYDGFIICADGKDTTHTTGQADAWVIKTDTNGCVVPGCNLKDGLVQLLNPDALIKVYPNPATDNVFISSIDNKAQLKSIILYDSKGIKLTEQKSNTTQQHLLETNAFAQGNYYLVIELVTGERAVKKIVIE